MEGQHFDEELKTYFNKIKSEIRNEHIEYLKGHPELREILNDFMSSVLLEKPNDIYDKVKFPPLVISGHTGSGKRTVAHGLSIKYPETIEESICYTTRMPRPGEIHGLHYYFVQLAEFEKEIKKENFASVQQIDGAYFGTHKGKLNAIVAKGKIAIVVMDVISAQKCHNQNPDWKYIYLQVKNTQEVEKRLRKKESLDETQIERNMTQMLTDNESRKRLQFLKDIQNDEGENKTLDTTVNYIKENYPTIKVQEGQQGQ